VTKRTRSGLILGTFRASAFVLGSIALAGSGFLQIVGYVLVLVGLPELFLLRAIREQTVLWTILGAIVVFVGSFVWVHLVARGYRVLRPTPPD
jgi:uncharacterized membrane protein